MKTRLHPGPGFADWSRGCSCQKPLVISFCLCAAHPPRRLPAKRCWITGHPAVSSHGIRFVEGALLPLQLPHALHVCCICFLVLNLQNGNRRSASFMQMTTKTTWQDSKAHARRSCIARSEPLHLLFRITAPSSVRIPLLLCSSVPSPMLRQRG